MAGNTKSKDEKVTWSLLLVVRKNVMNNGIDPRR